MLLALNVKNFAIIDNVQIEFKNGMTVLTGETGAGKSLIIDAISLLFGSRATNDLIRYGEEKAVIEGVFSDYSVEVTNVLQRLEIDYSLDDNLIIKRELHSNGKSICKINSQNVSLAQLQELSEYIGDIHSQEDTIGLVNPKNYLKFINSDLISQLLLDYKNSYDNYKHDLKEVSELEKKISEAKEKEDYLQYNLKEFEIAKINLTEEEELKKEANSMANYEHIVNELQEIEDIKDKGVLDDLYNITKNLERLANYSDSYEELKKNLLENYYNLEAILEDEALKISKIEFDSNRLEEINSRLAVYSDLKRKYKKEIPDIISYFEGIKKELDFVQNYDLYLSEAKKRLEKSYSETYAKATVLHEERVKIASSLEKEVADNLKDLQLKNTFFKISFNDIKEAKFQKDGLDTIDFLVTFNKGEPLKPLNKVASGGELSRFMLALKVALGVNLPQQTKIFDEIDHGVSGAVASSIGEKLKEISLHSQVLCITHLPQVAAIANNQILIEKHISDGRTYTTIKDLNMEERVVEIAKMLTNGKPSEASIMTSKELLGL